MLTQTQINTILKYIIFFISIYILTCFLDKKSVYYYLFVIFVLALICKLAFYSTNQTLVKLSWAFIGICVLSLFAVRIKGEQQKFGFFFDTLIDILSSLGDVIKSIFIESYYMYMFLFMVLGTIYASIMSQGNGNIGVIGWIIGIALGFCIWFFLSDGVSKPENAD